MNAPQRYDLSPSPTRSENAMRALLKPTLPHHRLWRNALIAILAVMLLLFLIRSAAL